MASRTRSARRPRSAPRSSRSTYSSSSCRLAWTKPIGLLSSCATPATSWPSERIFSLCTSCACVSPQLRCALDARFERLVQLRDLVEGLGVLDGDRALVGERQQELGSSAPKRSPENLRPTAITPRRSTRTGSAPAGPPRARRKLRGSARGNSGSVASSKYLAPQPRTARRRRPDQGRSDQFRVHRCRPADRSYHPAGTYRRQSQQCPPPDLVGPSPTTALQGEQMCAALSNRCDEGDYSVPEAAGPLPVDLNGDLGPRRTTANAIALDTRMKIPRPLFSTTRGSGISGVAAIQISPAVTILSRILGAACALVLNARRDLVPCGSRAAFG